MTSPSCSDTGATMPPCRRCCRPALLLTLAAALGYGWWYEGYEHHHQSQQGQQRVQRQVPASGSATHVHTGPSHGSAVEAVERQRGATGRSELLQDDLLREGDHLASPRGLFFLRVEGGVATARRGSPASPGLPLWESRAANAPQPVRRGAHALALHADGALVVISDDGAAAPTLVWSSGADGSASQGAAAAGGAHYALQLEDGDVGGGDGDSVSWAASVYSAPGQLHATPGVVPGRLVQRLFAFSPDGQKLRSPAANPKALTLPLPVLQPASLVAARPEPNSEATVIAGRAEGAGGSPGRVCFQPGDTSTKCALECGGADECASVLRSLWDAQALCSLRSNCSGVARLSGPQAADGTASVLHGHPQYDFRLCDANGGGSSKTAAHAPTWVRSPCDADIDGETAALLKQLHLVLTVKTSGKVHSTRVQ